jgi:hypothetical protein
MISLDPLYLLLLLEFLLIQALLIGFLYLKKRKLKIIYLKTRQMVSDLQSNQKTIPEKEAVTPAEPSDSGPEDLTPTVTPPVTDESDKTILELGEISPETEDLKKLLEEKIEIILQMKKKIEGMEKKFTDMENEYLVLFDQSQKQEQALKAAGLSFNKEEGDF